MTAPIRHEQDFKTVIATLQKYLDQKPSRSPFRVTARGTPSIQARFDLNDETQVNVFTTLNSVIVTAHFRSGVSNRDLTKRLRTHFEINIPATKWEVLPSEVL